MLHPARFLLLCCLLAMGLVACGGMPYAQTTSGPHQAEYEAGSDGAEYDEAEYNEAEYDEAEYAADSESLSMDYRGAPSPQLAGANPSSNAGQAANSPATTAQSWRRVTNAARFASVSLGGGHTLELRKVSVRVQVEGLRARTLVDHIFYNPHDRTIEGTFRYPLPPEASVSSYAMFLGQGNGDVSPDFFGADNLPAAQNLQEMVAQVDGSTWGALREGRIVRQERGREVFENTTRRQVDPALVEEVSPNTFEARVFPIVAHGFHRVIVSYEQTLPRVGSELEYVFPLPEAELESFDIHFDALQAQSPRLRYTGDLAGVEQIRRGGHHVAGGHFTGAMQAGSLAWRLSTGRGPEVLGGRNAERNENHFLIRLDGDARIPVSTHYAPTAVFLIDTSLSEAPDRFNLDAMLMTQILERSPRIRRFAVITFDAGARRLTQGFLANNQEGRDAALAGLHEILLEGATDLSAALDLLAAGLNGQQPAPDVFVLSDGALSWGERDAETLVHRFEQQTSVRPRFFAYRTGLGAENLALLRRLTQGGGVFNCLSTDSLPGCATAHHSAGLRIENVRVQAAGQAGQTRGGPEVHDVLIAGGTATLSREGELLIAGRFEGSGPAILTLTGTIGGQAAEFSYPIRLEVQGELAPRAWAEIAIAHLVATADVELEDLAVAMSQHYRVLSRLTSFLVLETDAEYEQFDLATARQAQQGEIAALVASVHGQTNGAGEVRTSWQRLQRAMRTGEAHHHLDGEVRRRIAAMASQGPVDFLRGRRTIPAVSPSDVPSDYRSARGPGSENAELYRQEGERRRQQENLGAAIRALSGAIENAPSNSEIARMVGYTLDTWGADAEAAEIFLGVLERRPYEPQSYRDLAGVLWTRRPSLSAMLYEAVLSGQWDGRFRGVVDIAREEYALFANAWQRRAPNSPLAGYLAERQQELGLTLPAADLRVTMTWNTDNTDIDLWVTDPDGDECYYGNRRIPSGGELLADVTQGFGPERFQSVRAMSGEYRVVAKYYGNNGNRLLAETYVTLNVATFVGTPQERIRRFVVSLHDRGDEETVARITMP